MSCFIVPMAQAVATTIYRKTNKNSNANLASLEKMLWGGVIMLAVDHIANGELFIFSLKEMLTVGVPMSISITVIWALYVAIKARRTRAASAR